MNPHDRRRRQVAIVNLVLDWPTKHFGRRPSPLTLELVALQATLADPDAFMPEGRKPDVDEVIAKAQTIIGSLLRDIGRLDEVTL
jgi:hypothetical protein